MHTLFESSFGFNCDNIIISNDANLLFFSRFPRIPWLQIYFFFFLSRQQSIQSQPISTSTSSSSSSMAGRETGGTAGGEGSV